MVILKACSENKNMSNHALNKAVDINQCPVTMAIDVIGGKWKVIILYQLRNKTLRFGEIKNSIPDISQKVLTRALKELEKDRLITRQAFAQVPPKVEYQQSELAIQLNPVLDSLCQWGGQLQEALNKS
jgi:DNA-binding HxlR family transcriptional regulator